MYCTKKITEDLTWVGENDRRIAIFEGVYSVPKGISYNSYLLKDEKNVLFDTADKAVAMQFLEKLKYELGDKKLNYIVIHHMEPDHSASLDLILKYYPDATIVCNSKTQAMIAQYFEFENNYNFKIVKENDTLNTGKHNLTFIMAPMIHWPEVMFTYDTTDKILFSADAFGAFGALNGGIFLDEANDEVYMKEFRRYYTNIVGKYGCQVQSALKKLGNNEIKYICPLHGYTIRQNHQKYIDKYTLWSSYTPEKDGVLITYASVYGNTAKVAEIVASKLNKKGIKTEIIDVSKTPISEIIAETFKWSHLIFASTTYNSNIFISMEDLLRDIVAHNLQNRTIAFIENGSWAATSNKLMQEILSECKNMTFIDKNISIKSSIKQSQENEINEFVEAISSTFNKHEEKNEENISNEVFSHIPYGLYLLSTKDNDKDNACIINTVSQITDNPKQICFSVNKHNYTHDIILKAKKANISCLTENTLFSFFERFGYQCGKDVNKFLEIDGFERSSNDIFFATKNSNSYISADIIKQIDCGSHTLFIAKVSEAKTINQEKTLTYDYYLNNIKPKPIASEHKNGYLCKICNYFYEGSSIPDDFICPICKHGIADFIYIE